MAVKRILITGVGGSAATNFIRSLRLAKEKFYIVGTDSSKYYAKLSEADKTYVVPPYTNSQYLVAILASMDRCDVQFIHAQPDPEVKFISDNREVFENFPAKTFLPSKRAIDICQDKYEFFNLMQENDIPVPNTELVDNPKRLKKLIKGEKLWLRASKGAGSLGALPVTNSEMAYHWIEYWRTKGLEWEDFIISDFLPGKEYAFQSIWKNGELVTSAARERLEYLFQARMPSGQSSTPTIAKSVHNNKVNEICTQAIKILDPFANGIFCVDLKENSKGIPCITEINCGRFFTTSLFFSTAGSNMPYIYVKLAFGEEIPNLPKYNAVPKDLYWIRQISCKEVLVKGEELDGYLS